MKKIIILFLAVFAILPFVSCNKESAPEQGPALPLTVNITVSDPHAGSRAVKSGWENGDVINFWFDANQSQVPDLTLTYQDGDWIPSGVRAEIAQDFKEEGHLKFFWEGSNSWNTWKQAYGPSFPNSYAPAAGNGFPLVLHESENRDDNVYHFDAATNTLTANLKWTYATNVQVVVEGITPTDGYRLSCEGGAWTAGDITVSKDYILLSNGDVPTLGVANGENATAFSFVVPESGEKTLDFKLTGPDGTETFYTVTKTFDFPSGEERLHFLSARIPKVRFYSGIVDGHPYVDMGEGHKWATTSVGADKPESVCDYFAWGDPEPYYVTQDPLVWKEGKGDGYNFPTYTRFVSEGGNFFTGLNKYTTADGKTVLEPEDDPATVNWSASWRTPTADEWQWLVDHCTWTWTTLNGVKGNMVTSQVTGSSIFLRATGCYTSNQPSTDQRTEECMYWSSTLNDYQFSAFLLSEYKDRPEDKSPISTLIRVFGLPVRPVVNE